MIDSYYHYHHNDNDSNSLQIPVKSMNSRYQKISNLGSGSFGTVSLFKVKNGILESLLTEMNKLPNTLLNPNSINFKYCNDLVAIKTMNKKLKRLNDYSNIKEIQFIFSVNSHFNLVQIIDVFIDRTHLKLNIVMENMDQNLYQLMKIRKGNVFSPKTLKSILLQLLSAILHIHKNLYFHRDVKPENILVMQNLNFFGSRSNIPLNQRHNSYIIKLADYGLARYSKNDKPFTAYVSTRWYRSPEILLRQGFYSFPVDIWAFGCVAVECATFCPLFPGANELDQCCKLMEFLGNPNKSFQLQTLKNYNVYNNNNNNNINNNNNYDSLVPFGGFWDDANDLALKLGLIFPKNFGYRLENTILRNDFNIYEKRNFFKMIKSCLTWDPNKRATAFNLLNSPYFADTRLYIENQKENETSMNNSFSNENKKLIHSNNNNNNNINNNYNNNVNNEINSQDLLMRRSMLFAGLPTLTNNSTTTTNNNSNNSSIVKLNPQKADIYLSPKNIKLSHPGLGINNKLNLINKNPLHNLSKNNNNKNYSNLNSEIDNSLLQLGSDPIEDYVNIFPDDSNILDLQDENDFSFSLKNSHKKLNQTDNELIEDFDPIDLNNIDNILEVENENESDNKDVNFYNFDSQNDKKIKTKVIDEEENDNNVEEKEQSEDDDDEEEDDDNDENNTDEIYNELVSFEMEKVSTFLQDPNTDIKPVDSEISIKNSNHTNNYDLIDEIDYVLDDEYRLKHSNIYI